MAAKKKTSSGRTASEGPGPPPPPPPRPGEPVAEVPVAPVEADPEETGLGPPVAGIVASAGEAADYSIIPAELRATSGRPAEMERPQLPNLAELTRQLLLEQFAPAAVLINRKQEVLYYFGPCTHYLEFPPGQPTHDVIRMAREGLRTRLRRAVQQAIGENERMELADVPVKRNGGYAPVRVTISPVQAPRAAVGLLLITFQEQGPGPPAQPNHAGSQNAGDDASLRQLEEELRVTQENLESTQEEMESSNEELMSSNEEVLSINEELRSTNQELETSKGELQSLNEELNVVNNQLREKVEEVEKTSNDIANLLDCTDIATVFLDAAFRIQLFTPAASRLFPLSASDAGRPFNDIRPQFSDPDLLADALLVQQQMTPREKEIVTADGSWWVRRILPYRTRDGRMDGVVITFVDITQRKQAADAVVRRLAAIVEGSADAIFSKDLDGTILTWNCGAERLYGYSSAEAVGRSLQLIVPDDRADELATILIRLRRGESIVQLETERLCKDGRRIQVALTISPLRDSSGKIVSASVIARDISERKRTEQALRDREGRLQAILNSATDAIITIDYQGLIRSVNSAAERMFGYAPGELIGQSVKLLMASPYREAHDGYLARYQQTREKHIIGVGREVEARRKDGSIFPTDLAVSEIEDLKLFTGIHRDLTQRKRLEREVVEAASLEQRRIGHDLHDSVAQELTALNLVVKDLAETLASDPAQAAPLVQRLAEGLQRSQQELRTVLHGLLPVAVDREGLMAALSDLADRIQKQGKVACTFDCPQPVALGDNLAATHLYLIGQEAVHNAVKHARARNVRIHLHEAKEGLVLRIDDDGIGMPLPFAPPVREEGQNERGLGLRIMQNRAAILGARLTIEPARPSGTVVTCVLARRNHERNQGETPSPGPDRR